MAWFTVYRKWSAGRPSDNKFLPGLDHDTRYLHAARDR